MTRYSTWAADADALGFFYEHAGWSYDPATETSDEGRWRGAEVLARAEREARARGWSVEWEYDPDPDPVTDYPQYRVALVNDEREILASIGSVDLGPDGGPDAHPYVRVLGAELAWDVIGS
jgi:hypothetical protein